MRCPYCNGETPHIEPEKLAEVSGVRGIPRMILEVLARKPGGRVLTKKLIDEVWGLDADGGPLDPHKNIAVAAFRLREKIEPYGYTAKGEAGVGRNACYRLIPISTDQREVV